MDRIISENKLETLTVAYTEEGKEVKGERLCKWAFNLLLKSEENIDKLSRRNMQIKELKKRPSIEEYNQVIQDNNDMHNACKTVFYRCSCGHLREQGIVCFNENCKARY